MAHDEFEFGKCAEGVNQRGSFVEYDSDVTLIVFVTI
jgi:hypothetical protein